MKHGEKGLCLDLSVRSLGSILWVLTEVQCLWVVRGFPASQVKVSGVEEL